MINSRTLLFGILCALAPLSLAAQTTPSPAPARASVDFDSGWLFNLADSPMAMQPKFDDSAWRPLNLPHDWSIEGPFSPDYGSGNGFAPGGIAWYRKHFPVDASAAGSLVTLELDGIYDNSEVFLNGFFVGGRPDGFESFTCNLTNVLNFGGDNVLAIRVDHSRFADSRWYTGSGIYRHVRLTFTNPLHLAHWGTFITTPVVTADSATVHLETAVENSSPNPASFTVQSDLLAPDGSVLASATTPASLDNAANQTISQNITIKTPALWSPDSPSLYTLRTRLLADNTTLDDTTTAFGIRTIAFDPATGFSLNGVPTKIKGVCLHQDGGSVGVAIPIQIWDRRLRALKELGVNAIRTSHNPPSPEFLDLCDQLGFLVMDEAFDEFTPGKNKWVLGWNQGSPSRFGYNEFFPDWSVRDISDQVRRDRNHPSIIMWSIGNEIDYPNDPFTDPALGDKYRPGNPPGTDMVKWGRPLVAAVKALDPTRPVTAALASLPMSNAVGFAQILDIDGYNYQESLYPADHQQYPHRVIYGSENKHDYASWLAVRDNPAISGQFLWTGIDYLGEARAWPARANPDGLLDLCGFLKPLGRYRQSLWSTHAMVYLCAAKTGTPRNTGGDTNGPSGRETWNWPDQTPLTISCYTNCPDVTLTLNDQPLGTKHLADATNGILTWQIPFTPGTLKAIGLKDGQTVCEFSLQTAGPPTRLILNPDRIQLHADGRDISQIEFDIEDDHDIRVPNATPEVTFTLTGPAKILGLGNGDITNSEPVTGPDHRAYQGRGLAILQTTNTPGPITLTATTPGLPPATLTLTSQ
jgi:beta-galactosidase